MILLNGILSARLSVWHSVSLIVHILPVMYRLVIWTRKSDCPWICFACKHFLFSACPLRTAVNLIKLHEFSTFRIRTEELLRLSPELGLEASADCERLFSKWHDGWLLLRDLFTFSIKNTHPVVTPWHLDMVFFLWAKVEPQFSATLKSILGFPLVDARVSNVVRKKLTFVAKTTVDKHIKSLSHRLYCGTEDLSIYCPEQSHCAKFTTPSFPLHTNSEFHIVNFWAISCSLLHEYHFLLLKIDI